MLKYELRLEIGKGKYKRIRSNNLDRVLDKTIESIRNEWVGVRVLSSEIWADVSINLDCEYDIILLNWGCNMSNGKKLVIIILFILLVGGIGYLIYLNMVTAPFITSILSIYSSFILGITVFIFPVSPVGWVL